MDSVLAQGALPLDILGLASSHASLLHGPADPAAAHFPVKVAAHNPDIWTAQAVMDFFNYQDMTYSVWVALLPSWRRAPGRENPAAPTLWSPRCCGLAPPPAF